MQRTPQPPPPRTTKGRPPRRPRARPALALLLVLCALLTTLVGTSASAGAVPAAPPSPAPSSAPAADGGASLGPTTYFGGAISIPEKGNANPMPSTIHIDDEGPRLTNLTVRLSTVDHGCVRDLDVLLVAPTGKSTVLMSDDGDSAVTPFGCKDIQATSILFRSDCASIPDPIPESSAARRPPRASAPGRRTTTPRPTRATTGASPATTGPTTSTPSTASTRRAPGSCTWWTTSANDPSAFAAGLYRKALRRPPTATETAAVVRDLGAGVSREQVAATLLASREGDTVVVATIYERFLRRSPPASETTYWVNPFQRGEPELALVRLIIASNEYYNNA